MKILFSPCHYVFGENEGSESSWSYNIADRIASVYKKSVVITGSKRTHKTTTYQIREIQKNKTKIDLSLLNALRFNFLYFKATNKELKKDGFDILHHVLPFGLGSTFNLSILTRGKGFIPVVIGPVQGLNTVSDDDIDLSNIRRPNSNKGKIGFISMVQKMVQPGASYLSYLTLKRADKIVVVNQFVEDILVKKGVDREKIKIIPPGIDTSRNAFYLREYSKNSINLLTCSYLLKRKNVDQIIKAVAILVKKNKNIHLDILGDGPQKDSLVQLVSTLGIEKNVAFHGHVTQSDIPKYYQKADIFIFMSSAEGFATVCLEAMASGLPIISSKVGGFLDVVKEGENGYLVEQNDYRSLAKKVVYLLNDRELMKKFSKKARQNAVKYYDWDKVIIPQYIELYSDIISSNIDK